jgi:signal transduction histidine kinase
LLEAQKTQEGLRQYHFVPASLAEIAERAVTAARSQAEAKAVRIDVESEPDLPKVLADQEAVNGAIENLLSNAIKYAPPRSVVKVTSYAVDDHVCLDVSDQGGGIAKDDLPHIFDRFYRKRRGNQDNVRGTGLGLALVKATVEAHGGTIEVTSAPGAGSRFCLRLPISGGGPNNGADSDSR